MRSGLLRTITLIAASTVALAAATGCSPVVSLHHTEVRGASGSGLNVVAVLEVENENAFDVHVRRVRARVTLADRYRLAPVDIQPNKWISANRKVKVAVPITIPWTEVPGVLAASAGSSSVPYHVRGTADVTAGRSARVRVTRYPIDQEGSIPRRHFMRGGVPMPRGGDLPLPF